MSGFFVCLRRPAVGVGYVYARALQRHGNEDYSEYDKRDAQQLSHVQSHAHLEGNLRILDELNKEACAENTCQECAEQEAEIGRAHV